MNRATILIIGSNKEMLQNTIEHIDSNNEWNIVSASTDEEAIEKFHLQHCDVVVLIGSVTSEEKRKLNKLFTYQRPEIIIMEHQDNNTNRLLNEIREALQKRENESRPSISIVDDALKNAGLNIHVQ